MQSVEALAEVRVGRWARGEAGRGEGCDREGQRREHGECEEADL